MSRLIRGRIATAVLASLCGCLQPAPPFTGYTPPPHRQPQAYEPADPATWGELAHEVDDLVFEGGHVHFEMRWANGRVIQTARNDFVVPVTIAWRIDELDNLRPDADTAGIAVLSPALEVGAPGHTEVLTTFTISDVRRPFYRYLSFKAQFGDPDATPAGYAYAIPFLAGDEHRIIQGFGGTFSHTGGNLHAIDFECAEGTPVVAARDGTVVAINDRASSNGTTEEFVDYAHTNFVLIVHDDGTLGQYMHLQHGGVDIRPGQRVRRGQYIARSGNTGFSTTPHLHFQVMTAAADGQGAASFPFTLQVAPQVVEAPQERRSYRAFERVD